MLKFLLGLVLLASFVNAQETFDCSPSYIPLVEYQRVEGTDDLDWVEVGHFYFFAQPQFAWNGWQIFVISLDNYPGAIDQFSFESTHKSIYGNHPFPQSHRTNQLIVDDFEIHNTDIIRLRGRRTAKTNLRITNTRNFVLNDEFFYAFNMKTVDLNGAQHSMWALGTEFQVYNWGKQRYAPLHNGFVNNNFRCPNPTKCIPSQSSSRPMVVGSGNPALFPYADGSSCTTTLTPVSSTGKTLVVLTWVGVSERDHLIISEADGSNAHHYSNFEFGYQIIIFDSPSVKIEWTGDENRNKSVEVTLPVHGFRAVVTEPSVGNCFTPHAGPVEEACIYIKVSDCVVTLEPSCAFAWSDACCMLADICTSYVDSGIASATYPVETSGVSDYQFRTTPNGKYATSFEEETNTISTFKVNDEPLSVSTFPQLSTLKSKKLTN